MKLGTNHPWVKGIFIVQIKMQKFSEVIGNVFP
jgi:hypothetical protein